MNAVDVIAEAARSTGYREEAIVRDYLFADVLDPTDTTREVALAAFTQTPPSYRSAALAAVSLPGGGDTTELVQAHRALGAPLLFVIEGEQLSLWQVRGDTPRCLYKNLRVGDVSGVFERNQEEWCPDAIHRAKSIGAIDESYQLDFVDLGLLPALEGEIHAKLDRLIVDSLVAATDDQDGRLPETRILFPVLFRLLAAKVLQDRGHPDAEGWNVNNLVETLHGIESYYSLPSVMIRGHRNLRSAFSAAWECLRKGLSFANISSDDLAFVYENTLVTPETRKHFGTHSTPRQLAEYAVARLELHRYEPDALRIYEPFTGAGTFLVSALRHMRELLAVEWSDAQRHDFLVERISGDEIDPFACEVAKLSLILADYPNRNSWCITQTDLFKDNLLMEHMSGRNIILCNPPFENFNGEERSRYPIANTSLSKPTLALEAALAAHPFALGFVLPHSFLTSKKYARQRKKIEKLYDHVELVELPKHIFRASVIESSLLIARKSCTRQPSMLSLRSTEVWGRDRTDFLKTGRITTARNEQRVIQDFPTGDLWIPALKDIWDYQKALPRLDDHFIIHRGLEWQSDQDAAWSNHRRTGYRRGFHTARKLKQFQLPKPVWLDCREERLRGEAIKLPWHQRKLVVNAGRLSIGPWRIAAMTDWDGLLCSQQFFGLWPREHLSDRQLLAYTATLNGPLANAFLATHWSAKGIRISSVRQIPIPPFLPLHIGELVAEYAFKKRAESGLDLLDGEQQEALAKIDAEVLRSYDLPLRFERQLLKYFRDAKRPVAHNWQHWDVMDPTPGLTLAERTSRRFDVQTSWIREVFQPLPDDEAEILRAYGG